MSAARQESARVFRETLPTFETAVSNMERSSGDRERVHSWLGEFGAWQTLDEVVEAEERCGRDSGDAATEAYATAVLRFATMALILEREFATLTAKAHASAQGMPLTTGGQS